MSIPKEYLNLDDDFGFSAVDSEEEKIINMNMKLLEVEKLIIPLLVNLMKDPEKDTIKWPNRKPIIEKQIEKILAITRS